jgi:hypothetical protein
LRAVKAVKTVQQIAKEYELLTVQVSDRKKTIQEGLAGLFERGGSDRERRSLSGSATSSRHHRGPEGQTGVHGEKPLCL